jgi:hypothetical protein
MQDSTRNISCEGECYREPAGTWNIPPWG